MKKKQKKLFLQSKKRSLKKIVGTPTKPRLAVFRSHKHIYAQLIDDKNAQTLAFSSTLDKDCPSLKELTAKATKEASFIVGKNLGKKAIAQNIQQVVFDRGRYPYHGRIEQLAEGARQEGLKF
jgi:large subunit ribosomal protein L18